MFLFFQSSVYVLRVESRVSFKRFLLFGRKSEEDPSSTERNFTWLQNEDQENSYYNNRPDNEPPSLTRLQFGSLLSENETRVCTSLERFCCRLKLFGVSALFCLESRTCPVHYPQVTHHPSKFHFYFMVTPKIMFLAFNLVLFVALLVIFGECFIRCNTWTKCSN